jgi:hypothetical protein
MRQRLWGALVIGGVIAAWVIVAWPSGGVPAVAGDAGAPAEPPMPIAQPQPSAPLAQPSPANEAEPTTAQPQPAPQPAAPEAKAAPPAEPERPHDIIQEPYGPLDELKQRYARETRASAAVESESLLTAAFADANLTPPLLKSVLCHEQVCKLEINWSADRMSNYIVAMTKASLHFDPNPGVEPREWQSDRIRHVDAYLILKPAK